MVPGAKVGDCLVMMNREGAAGLGGDAAAAAGAGDGTGERWAVELTANGSEAEAACGLEGCRATLLSACGYCRLPQTAMPQWHRLTLEKQPACRWWRCQRAGGVSCQHLLGGGAGHGLGGASEILRRTGRGGQLESQRAQPPSCPRPSRAVFSGHPQRLAAILMLSAYPRNQGLQAREFLSGFGGHGSLAAVPSSQTGARDRGGSEKRKICACPPLCSAAMPGAGALAQRGVLYTVSAALWL